MRVATLPAVLTLVATGVGKSDHLLHSGGVMHRGQERDNRLPQTLPSACSAAGASWGQFIQTPARDARPVWTTEGANTWTAMLCEPSLSGAGGLVRSAPSLGQVCGSRAAYDRNGGVVNEVYLGSCSCDLLTHRRCACCAATKMSGNRVTRSFFPLTSRTTIWCGSESISLTRNWMHSISRRPQP